MLTTEPSTVTGPAAPVLSVVGGAVVVEGRIVLGGAVVIGGRTRVWCAGATSRGAGGDHETDAGQQRDQTGGPAAGTGTGTGRGHRRENSSVWMWWAGTPRRCSEASTVAVMPGGPHT